MPLELEFFPEGVILLNAELATGLHPRLESLLSNHSGAADEWEIRIAEIAAYCGIVLDGTYPPEQIGELAAILSGRLMVLRELPEAQKILPLS